MKKNICTVLIFTMLSISSCTKGNDKPNKEVIENNKNTQIESINDKNAEQSENEQLLNEESKITTSNNSSTEQNTQNVKASKIYDYTYSPNVDTPEGRAYTEYVKNFPDASGYTVKDLDNDGISELIIKKALTLTVYGYNGEIFEIGSNDFATGSLRLLYSKKYPGIISFTVGGGANHYRYVTVRDGELVIEDIWNDYYAYDGVVITVNTEEFTDDKTLIKESKLAYENYQDISFLPIEH